MKNKRRFEINGKYYAIVGVYLLQPEDI